MIKHFFSITFLLLFSYSYSQTNYEFTIGNDDKSKISIDTSFVKSIEYSKERTFKKELKDKYSGKEFTYDDYVKESEPDPIVPEVNTETSNGSSAAFGSFMSTIFPILLGIVVVLIVLKVFFNLDTSFWKVSKVQKEDVKKLISEEENIDENDYEKLLQLAVKKKDYRLATRYYYLSLLKNLSQKNHIEYHKDKTNAEYQFELKDKKMRSAFSYLSYIYSYVWYGEFSIDEFKFAIIEEKYQSFIKGIK